MKALLEHCVKRLVDHPDQVTITERTDEGKLIVDVRVGPHDLGRVIGSEGRTFRALRSLVQILSNDATADLVVDIVEQ